MPGRSDNAEYYLDSIRSFCAQNYPSDWEMPEDIEVFGLDGSTWIIEGIRDGEYHMVHRWSPDAYKECAAVFALGSKFLDLYGKAPVNYCLAMVWQFWWVHFVIGTPVLLVSFVVLLARKMLKERKNQ